MDKIRKFIDKIPVIRHLARSVSALLKRFVFRDSQEYWKKRYVKGGISGSGSYRELAEFKADTLNSFVAKNNIRSVIEFGCGDGNQLSQISYPTYIGLDISHSALKLCIEHFAGDDTKSFFLYDPDCFIDNQSIFKVDLALSLDVIYHLVEYSLFECHMQHLFSAADKYVIIYSSDSDDNRYFEYPHVKHHKFTKWIDLNLPNWKLIQRIPNRYPYKGPGQLGSWCDFFIYNKD